MAAHGAVKGQLAFMRGLHRGDGTFLGGGDFSELCRARLADLADAQMVADDQQERFAADELAGTPHGVAIPQRRRLLDERQASSERTRGGAVGRFIARADDDADFGDAGRQHLLDQDRERGLCAAVTVDEALERQCPLVGSGAGQKGTSRLHGGEWISAQSPTKHGMRTAFSQSAATGAQGAARFAARAGRTCPVGVRRRSCLGGAVYCGCGPPGQE